MLVKNTVLTELMSVDLRCLATLDWRRRTLRLSDRNVSGVMTYKWLSVHVLLLVDSSERAVFTHRLDVLEIMV